MKKLVLLALIGVTMFACETKPVKDYSILSGEISNFRKKNIEIVGYNFREKIPVNRSLGVFSDTLKIEDGHYTLFVDKKPINIYLTKAKDSKIILDAKKIPESIVFEGTNAEINKYLQRKVKAYSSVIKNANVLFSKDEDNFVTTMKKYKALASKLVKNSNLDTAFVSKEVRNINYEYARNLNNYEEYHKILTRNREYQTPDDFPSEIPNIDFNSSIDYTNSFSYRKLLQEHLNKLATDKTEKDEDADYDLTLLETIHTEVTDTLVKNDLIYNIATKSITYTPNIHEFYKKFMAYSTNKEHKDEMTTTYNSLKEIAKGQPAPDFNDYENIKGGTTSFSDLKGNGNYLFIDVWATWCGFCKREVPLIKKLEQDYRGKNIEFVGISIDKKNAKARWKKMVEEKEMPGVQLFADKDWDSDIATKYLIKGLPRFIIVDPDGNIVTSNAPAPSNPKLTELLDELLGKERS